jgi:hypothetical protein
MSAAIALQMTGARRIVAMPSAAVSSASLQLDQLLPAATFEHQVTGVASRKTGVSDFA